MNDFPKIGLDINEMSVEQLREVVKMCLRLLNYETDRTDILQNRVLELEKHVFGDTPREV